MVLSNAERQARYRKRLKERASLDALGDRVRDAMDAALASMWGHYQRNAAEGDIYADVDGIDDFDQFRDSFTERQSFVDACREWVRDPVDMTEEEIAPLKLVVEIADAINLR